jgi:hypothetical protein
LLLAALLFGLLLAIVSVVWMLLRLLPAKKFVICSAEAKDRPGLELRPQSRYLGLGSFYKVADEHGATLATLCTNHLYNLFRERWQGATPDGHTWFSVAENSAVPRVIRRAVHAGVGMFFLVALFVGLVIGITTLVAVAPFGIPLLLSLAVALPLAVLYPILCVLAFVQRKVLPNCRLVRSEDGSVLGEFRRDPDARKPNILSMNRDQANPLDRRVALAAAILLNKRA